MRLIRLSTMRVGLLRCAACNPERVSLSQKAARGVEAGVGRVLTSVFRWRLTVRCVFSASRRSATSDSTTSATTSASIVSKLCPSFAPVPHPPAQPPQPPLPAHLQPPRNARTCCWRPPLRFLCTPTALLLFSGVLISKTHAQRSDHSDHRIR